MAEFVPADGEEFERVDQQSHAWDGPQTKEHDRIDDYLSTRLEHTEVEKGGNALRRGHSTGREREDANGEGAWYLAPGHV
jgi:hypothetical protein